MDIVKSLIPNLVPHLIAPFDSNDPQSNPASNATLFTAANGDVIIASDQTAQEI